MSWIKQHWRTIALIYIGVLLFILWVVRHWLAKHPIEMM